MRKILFGLFILFLLSAVCADGIIFTPDFEINPTRETTQVAIIDVAEDSYEMRLFVSIYPGDWPNEYIYWAVPLDEVPQDIELESYEDSDFEQRVQTFNSEIRAAEGFQRRLANFSGMIGFGMVLSNPIGLPFGIVLSFMTVTMSAGGIGGMESLATYDFGDIGSAEVYDATTQQSLEEILFRAGVEPGANLTPYLDKKIALFKLKNKESMGMVATFKFNQNEKIYFPSGTTQYFDEAPQRFGVLIKAPRNFVYDESSGIKYAQHFVGASSQYFIFNKSGKQYEYYDDYRYPGGEVGDYEIFKKDLSFEYVGERPISIREVLASIVDPFLLGLFLGLVVSGGVIAGFLKFRKKLDLLTFGKFVLFYFLLLFVVISIPILLMIVGIMSSLGYALSSPSLAGTYFTQFAAMLLFLLVPLAGAISFFLFKRGKKLKKWAGFTRVEVLGVSFAILVVDIIIGFLFVLLP